jgi:hypothetical protein
MSDKLGKSRVALVSELVLTGHNFNDISSINRIYADDAVGRRKVGFVLKLQSPHICRSTPKRDGEGSWRFKVVEGCFVKFVFGPERHRYHGRELANDK